MPVCLHCGEIASEGALFCGKCGYTLPQEGAKPAPTLPPRAAPGPPAPPPSFAPSPPVAAARLGAPLPPTGAYAVPVSSIAGAVPSIAPPPSAKYCVRCATLISRAAVFCPVCQQPQP